MNDQSPPTDPLPAATLPDDAPADTGEENAQAERLKRRLTKVLEPEHADEFARLVRSLPPGEALKAYRAFFTPAAERQSLPLVHVSVKRLTQQAIVSALPRIVTSRPDIAQEFVHVWFDLYADVIDAMLGGEPLPEDVSTDVLSTAQFILDGELPEGEATSALTTALDRAAQLQADCAAWQDRHAAAQAEVTRLSRELGHVTEKLRRAEERVTSSVLHEREQAGRRAEREQRRAQQALAASEREIEAQQARHDQELAAARRTIEQLERGVRAGEHERSQQLNALLTRERAESERLRARHAQQLKELRGTITALQEELAAHADQQDPLFDEALLDDALVISYATVSSDPIERLTTLFEAYAAFLAGRREHEGLVRHSNISQFKGRQPVGILLLGLEQLLLDGVNVPLTRYLTMRSFRQEAVLHQLIGRLDSPRLTGAS